MATAAETVRATRAEMERARRWMRERRRMWAKERVAIAGCGLSVGLGRRG